MKSWGTLCECGQSKDFGSEACPRCLFLDGRTVERYPGEVLGPEAMVISLLREVYPSPLTYYDLADGCGRCLRSIRRCIDRLRKSGRVSVCMMKVEHQDRRGGYELIAVRLCA